MISVELARKLRDAGLEWHPVDGDRFFIPDRDLEDTTFSISDMSVAVRDVPGGREIAFNGAVEWALDGIMQREVVWLPSETQLRQRLDDDFVSLGRRGSVYECTITGPGEGTYRADTAPDAYGSALLAALESSPDVLPRLYLDEL